MNRVAERAILSGGADIYSPIRLCANIFTQGHHPACVSHERVDREGATRIQPIFFETRVKACGERNECVLNAGERIPACFDDDAATQGVE